MKSVKPWTQFLMAGFTSLVATGIALAQESTGTAVPQEAPSAPVAQETTRTAVTHVTRTTTTVWYTEWWVWAIGIAVFLIVVIALTNRGKSGNT